MDPREGIRTDPFAYLNEEAVINILGFIGTNTNDPNRPSIGYERLKWLGITADSRQYFDPEEQSTENVRGTCGVVGAARLSCVLAAVCKSWRDFMEEHSNRIAPGLELNLFQLKLTEAEPVYQWMVRTQAPIRSLIFDVYADRNHEELLLQYLPLCNTKELVTAHVTVPKEGLDRGRMGADIRLQNFLAEHCPKLKNLRINLYTRILSIWAGWNCCPEEFPAISPALRSKPSIECVNLVINKPQNLNVDLNINAKLFSWFIQDWPSLRYFQLACNCRPRPAMQIRSNTLQKLYVSKCLDGFLFDLDCPKLKVFGFGGQGVLQQQVTEARNIPDDCQAVFLGDDYSENLSVPFRLVLEDNRADLLRQIQAMFPISTRENPQLPRARFEQEGVIDIFDNGNINNNPDFRRLQRGGLQPGEIGPLPRELVDNRHRPGRDRYGALRPGQIEPLPLWLAEDDDDDDDINDIVFDQLHRPEYDGVRHVRRFEIMLRQQMREMRHINRDYIPRPHSRPRQGQEAQIDAVEPAPLVRDPTVSQSNNETAPPRRNTFTDSALSMLELGRELIASLELFQDPPI